MYSRFGERLLISTLLIFLYLFGVFRGDAYEITDLDTVYQLQFINGGELFDPQFWEWVWELLQYIFMFYGGKEGIKAIRHRRKYGLILETIRNVCDGSTKTCLSREEIEEKVKSELPELTEKNLKKRFDVSWNYLRDCGRIKRCLEMPGKFYME